jgi:hypothetical protein
MVPMAVARSVLLTETTMLFRYQPRNSVFPRRCA